MSKTNSIASKNNSQNSAQSVTLLVYPNNHTYRYCDNADEAVEVLCEGGLYSDALEVSQSRKRVDLISNIMSSLKMESEQSYDMLVERRVSAEKLAARIVVVREKRSLV